jgi:hypothetical protein
VDMGWKCSYYSRIIDDVIAPNALFVVLNNYVLLHCYEICSWIIESIVFAASNLWCY